MILYQIYKFAVLNLELGFWFYRQAPGKFYFLAIRLVNRGAAAAAWCGGAPVREGGSGRVGNLQEAEAVLFPGSDRAEEGRRWVVHGEQRC